MFRANLLYNLDCLQNLKGLGQATLMQGRYRSAILACHKHLQIDGSDGEVFEVLGEACLMSQSYEDARTHFQSAERIYGEKGQLARLALVQSYLSKIEP